MRVDKIKLYAAKKDDEVGGRVSLQVTAGSEGEEFWRGKGYVEYDELAAARKGAIAKAEEEGGDEA
jgi:hypothetical protein